MRTMWNGSISFGLVNIPVGLAPATKPAARQSDVSFRTLHRECLTPIRQKRWCPVHDREVGPDEIVKGWEVTKGQFVVVEDADLEALERVDESRAIEITRFVPLEQVDPVYFDRTYFLTPAPATAARRPYVLLLAAMRETGMGGIGRMVIRGKEYQCLIRPKGDALALETLFLAEDVHSQAEIEEAVAEAEVRDQELDLARQVIASLADEFDPAALESRYRRDLRALLEAKLEGVEPAKPEPVAGRAGRRPARGAPRERRAGLEEEAEGGRGRRGEEAEERRRLRVEDARGDTQDRLARRRGASAVRPRSRSHTFGTVPSHTCDGFLVTLESGRRCGGPRRGSSGSASATRLLRPLPRAAPGRASCRSCRGRSGSPLPDTP